MWRQSRKRCQSVITHVSTGAVDRTWARGSGRQKGPEQTHEPPHRPPHAPVINGNTRPDHREAPPAAQRGEPSRTTAWRWTDRQRDTRDGGGKFSVSCSRASVCCVCVKFVSYRWRLSGRHGGLSDQRTDRLRPRGRTDRTAAVQRRRRAHLQVKTPPLPRAKPGRPSRATHFTDV